MDNLLGVREKIDAIDEQLLALLSERASLALGAAKYKLANMQSAKIFAPERELSIITDLITKNPGPLSNAVVADVFQTIINHCRNLEDTKHTEQIATIRIAVQGDKGSFSEQAARRFCRNKALSKTELDYVISSQRVVDAVLTEADDYGIVALNNARGGLVLETIEALTERAYRIVDMFPILVQQNLLVQKGMAMEAIKTVYSHPQALAQCQSYLAKNLSDAKPQVYEDTASAAKDLAAGKLGETSAVIASQHCAERYGLQCLAESIQDLPDNHTLFLVLARR